MDTKSTEQPSPDQILKEIRDVLKGLELRERQAIWLVPVSCALGVIGGVVAASSHPYGPILTVFIFLVFAYWAYQGFLRGRDKGVQNNSGKSVEKQP